MRLRGCIVIELELIDKRTRAKEIVDTLRNVGPEIERQSRTRKWPVLDAFGPPLVDLSGWQLKIFGLVEKPLTLTLDQFRALPRVKVFSDFHCVTKWSRLGNVWEGVATRELLALAGVQPQAKYVVCHGYDNNWTTNLPLSNFLQEDCLLADTHDGEPIPLEHGGPVRNWHTITSRERLGASRR